MRHMFLPKKNESFEIPGLYVGLVTLGFITIVSQLILIREFLNVFQGNELIIGLIFFLWMIFTALGSSISKRFKKPEILTLKILFILEGILPVATLFLLHLFIYWFLPFGTQGDIFLLLMLSVILLLPFCCLSGLLFAFLSAQISYQTRENRLAVSYGFESTGSVLAGMSFSIGMGYLLSAYQLLALVFLASLLVFTILFHPKRLMTYPILLIFALLTVFLLLFPPDNKIRSLHYKGQELLYYKDTPFGSIAVTNNSGQYNIFSNNNLVISTSDQTQFEESVHFPLLQRPASENVLIISGGMVGMTKQVMKYKTLVNADYIDINPWLIKAEQIISGDFSHEKMNIIVQDPGIFIKRTNHRYDAILVNSPDPMNAQLNRYFTIGFFLQAKKALNDGGVFEIALSSTMNYPDQHQLSVNRIVYNTLKKVFKNVLIIVGQKNYFLASDGPLSYNIAALQKETRIQNDYVNEFYFDDDLIRQKSNVILSEIIKGKAVINKDFYPVAYFSQLANWINKSEGQRAMPVIIITAILLFFIFGWVVIRNVSFLNAPVLTVAFAGASAEFLLIFIFQVLFGYIYLWLGAIVAIYMAGLATGTLIPYDYLRSNKKAYLILQLLLLIVILSIPFVAFLGENSISIIALKMILLFITACIAVLSGLIYKSASYLYKIHPGKSGAGLYAIDLAGAASGSLITSLLFFPLMGLWITVLLITTVLLTGFIITWFKVF